MQEILHQEQTAWTFGAPGLIIPSIAYFFSSFPKSCTFFNASHFPHNLEHLLEVLFFQSPTKLYVTTKMRDQDYLLLLRF